MVSPFSPPLRRTRSGPGPADQLRDDARAARDSRPALLQPPEGLEARIVHALEVREVEAQLRPRVEPAYALSFQEGGPLADEVAGHPQGRPAAFRADADHRAATSLVRLSLSREVPRGAGPLAGRELARWAGIGGGRHGRLDGVNGRAVPNH